VYGDGKMLPPSLRGISAYKKLICRGRDSRASARRAGRVGERVAVQFLNEC
jgi:hypothetical protein